MPTVIATHEVKDTAHWLAAPGRDKFLGALGVSVRTFVDPQQSNRVGLVLEAPDVDALMTALQSPEATAAMEADGVLRETLVLLLES